MTAWPTWFESSVWKTPITPVTIGMRIIPATRTVSRPTRFSGIAVSSTPTSRNDGSTPSAAETTIRPQTTASRAR